MSFIHIFLSPNGTNLRCLFTDPQRASTRRSYFHGLDSTGHSNDHRRGKARCSLPDSCKDLVNLDISQKIARAGPYLLNGATLKGPFSVVSAQNFELHISSSPRRRDLSALVRSTNAEKLAHTCQAVK